MALEKKVRTVSYYVDLQVQILTSGLIDLRVTMDLHILHVLKPEHISAYHCIMLHCMRYSSVLGLHTTASDRILSHDLLSRQVYTPAVCPFPEQPCAFSPPSA